MLIGRDLADVGQTLGTVANDVLVVPHHSGDVGQGEAQLLQSALQVLTLIRQVAVEGGHLSVELPHLSVVLREHGHELLEIHDRRTDVLAGIRERHRGP